MATVVIRIDYHEADTAASVADRLALASGDVPTAMLRCASELGDIAAGIRRGVVTVQLEQPKPEPPPVKPKARKVPRRKPAAKDAGE